MGIVVAASRGVPHWSGIVWVRVVRVKEGRIYRFIPNSIQLSSILSENY